MLRCFWNGRLVATEPLSTMRTHPDQIFSSTRETLASKTVLITGGTGFLGSFIVNAVLQQHPDWAVTVLDLKLPSTLNPKITYEVGDVTNATSISEIVERVRPDVVIHSAGIVPEFAARYGRQQKGLVFNVNVNGTRNMLAAAKASGTRAFVWTGSCTAVTDDMRYQYANVDESWPTSSHSLIYGESKVGYITNSNREVSR